MKRSRKFAICGYNYRATDVSITLFHPIYRTAKQWEVITTDPKVILKGEYDLGLTTNGCDDQLYRLDKTSNSFLAANFNDSSLDYNDQGLPLMFGLIAGVFYPILLLYGIIHWAVIRRKYQ